MSGRGTGSRQAIDNRAFARLAPASSDALADFSVKYEPVQALPTPMGTRFIYAVRLGAFEGPFLQGTLLPGSADWVTACAGRIPSLHICTTLRTHDGELISIRSTPRTPLIARNSGNPRLPEGSSSNQLPTCGISFETDAKAYRWLNTLSAIAVNEFSVIHARYRVRRVK